MRRETDDGMGVKNLVELVESYLAKVLYTRGERPTFGLIPYKAFSS